MAEDFNTCPSDKTHRGLWKSCTSGKRPLPDSFPTSEYAMYAKNHVGHKFCKYI
jgi:hypothetical protein